MHDVPAPEADNGPKCLNCGGFVTRQYVKVRAPPELEQRNRVRTCPNCLLQREGAEVRPPRSKGDPGTAHERDDEITSYGEGKADD